MKTFQFAMDVQLIFDIKAESKAKAVRIARQTMKAACAKADDNIHVALMEFPAMWIPLHAEPGADHIIFTEDHDRDQG